MKPGQFDSLRGQEKNILREDESLKSLQFQQLLKIMEKEQASQLYETIQALAVGEFKDSKLRDPNGELMIVWHGSPRKIDAFKTDAPGEYRWRNRGIHFSSSREVIEQYADKAYSAIRTILHRIAQKIPGVDEQTPIQGEVLVVAKKIYNEMMQNIITNGENSVYYKKGYSLDAKQEKVRKPDLDALSYDGEMFGTEWSLEIFNGQMPSADNSYFDEQNGIIMGNGIGKYEYAAVLNIQNPYTAEVVDIDQAFQNGEDAHENQNTDGTILFHKEAVIGNGGLKIEETKGTYSVAVFDPTKIKILGRIEGGKFVSTDKSEASRLVQSNLEFLNLEITPEKSFKFSVGLQKRPMEIKDGDTLGGNFTEVKFEGKLKDLMQQASELRPVPEKERILKLIELVRANLTYPYSDIINGLKETDPSLGQWLSERFGDEASRVSWVGVNDCLDRGYGNCKIMAATFLTLAQAAGLRGMFGQNGEDKVHNLIRPDTGKPMFKMGEVGKPVAFSHAWAEIQLQDGSWAPVDLTANMAGISPEMLEFFKKANYKTQIPVIFDGMPKDLDRNPPAVKFEPGQSEGVFNMEISIRQIVTMSRTGGSSKPAVAKFNGDLKLSLIESSEGKAANLSIL